MVRTATPVEYKKISLNFKGGLDMTSDPQNVKDDVVVISENMRMSSRGFLYTRYGIELKTDFSTNNEIEDMGVNHQRNVLFAKCNATMYAGVSADTMYDIGVVRTADTDEVLHDFGDYMIATNGTDNMITFIVGLVGTQFIASDTTIVLGAGHNQNFRTPNTGNCTATAGTDVIDAVGHGLVNGDRVAFWSDDTLPGGISEWTEYFVINKNTDDFKISTTYGGSAVDITDAGTGTHSFTDGICYCKGKMFVYTGKSGNNFTGARVQSGTYTVGLAVTQSFDPLYGKKGTCMYDLDEKLLLGGVSGYEDMLYYSATSSEANPEYVVDFTAGDASGKRMPSAITALMSGSKTVLIGLKKGIYYAQGFNATSGALESKRITDNFGVPNAQCIIYMDPYYFVFTGKRILQIYVQDDGRAQLIEPTRENEFRPFDHPVQGLLAKCDADQSGAFGYYDPNTNHMIWSVVINSINQEAVWDNNSHKWVSVDKGKPVACRVSYNSRTYSGDVNAGKIYLEDEGLADGGITIAHRVLTREYVYDDERATIDLTEFYHAGYLSGAGDLNLHIYANGKKQNTINIHALDKESGDGLVTLGLMDLDSGTPIGGGVIGGITFLSSGDEEEVFDYDYPLGLLDSATTYQFEFETIEEGTQWALRQSKLIGETTEENVSVPTQ